MKSSTQNNSQTHQTQNAAKLNKQRPDIRDDMDHREGEENLRKGDDVTHNKTETKGKQQKKK